ncbi:MAG: ubiquinol-cytochrome c reductase iron-sulfur subunit [Candidatus Eisenbacteria bacterium]
MPKPPCAVPDPERRRFLRISALLGGTVLFPALGCGTKEEARAGVDIDVSSLAVGQRMVVEYETLPIEIIRESSGYVARSLLCTHQGCVVEWQAEDSFYLCPCHEARFDPEGRPVFGPAQRPLHEYETEERSGALRVFTDDPATDANAMNRRAPGEDTSRG